jgi:hypothetical protein
MQIQPYLFLEGRCEEAIEFYKKALGAQVTMLMRIKDSPEPPPPGMHPPGSENKVMHASLRIGGPPVRRARRGRPGADAARQDVLFARLRHGRRPLRCAVDGDRAAVSRTQRADERRVDLRQGAR